MDFYGADLAFIHDAGFADYGRDAARGILQILQEKGIQSGLLVDLGCGSGVTSQIFSEAGFEVLGFDISESMVAMAHERAPKAEFLVGSIYSAVIPPCQAVTCIGEVLNYIEDPYQSENPLDEFLGRISNALLPGGMLFFDIAVPGQVESGTTVKAYAEGDDWVCLFEKNEQTNPPILTRKITTFRKENELYRRSDETHYQRLFEPAELARTIEKAGLAANIADGYGDFKLPGNRTVLIGLKT